MKLFARIIEGVPENKVFQAECTQDGYNKLWNIGKKSWDFGDVSKYEIGVFTDDLQLFWSIRPDKWNFEKNRHKGCFIEYAEEELKSFLSPDFQSDALEMDYIKKKQALWMDNPAFLEAAGILPDINNDSAPYYEVQISMNEISKLKYVDYAEIIKEHETLDSAMSCAKSIYEDLKNGKSSEYLSECIYRPDKEDCITGVQIMKVDGNDGSHREYVGGFSFEPYLQEIRQNENVLCDKKLALDDRMDTAKEKINMSEKTLSKLNGITEITTEQANLIYKYMDFGNPNFSNPRLSESGYDFLNETGKYYVKTECESKNVFTGLDCRLDNDYCVEYFENLNECKAWLRGEFEMSGIDEWRKNQVDRQHNNDNLSL